jgi:hypothetical protein
MMENLKNDPTALCILPLGTVRLTLRGLRPSSHSVVVCANCGRENDVTSLLIVAKSKGMEIAEDYADELVEKMTKNLFKTFKNSKFIKIK